VITQEHQGKGAIFSIELRLHFRLCNFSIHNDEKAYRIRVLLPVTIMDDYLMNGMQYRSIRYDYNNK
jgi:hypothetical protein